MTVKNLFEFDDYRAYLRHFLAREGARSGLRAKFATALGCQASYVSQVLSGDVHLSLEQAFRANQHLEHDTHESHFFMLLVQKDRAGSVELEKYFRKQIDDIKHERTKIKNRIVATRELSEGQQARYYSHSDFASVHMALAVPRLRTVKALCLALRLSIDRVQSVLDFLQASGLAEKNGDRYSVGGVHLHLGPESPFLQQHHANWRIEAMRRMNSQSATNLHYSATYSLSKKDFVKLRENLLQVIEKNLSVVRPSPEEIVICQNIDLIPLTEGDF